MDPESPTDWQPQVLVFTEQPGRRRRLLWAAGWITGGAGMLTAVQLIEWDAASGPVRQACDDAEAALRVELQEQGLDAYPLVVAAPDLRVGASTLLQSWGVGPIQSNTVMLNWYDSQNTESLPTLSLWYARLLQRAARLGQHVVVLDADDEDWQTLEASHPDQRRIDVWWFGGDSSRLALLCAYLMTRGDHWDEATIRVLEPAPTGSTKKSEASLRKRLEELRINAEVVVVDTQDGPAMFEASADASFVLIPRRLEGMSTFHPGGGPVDELFEPLPVVAMVAASGDVKLTPDENVTPAADAVADSSDPSDSLASGEPAS